MDDRRGSSNKFESFKMKNLSQINVIMIRMSALLRAGNKESWAERLDDYRAELSIDYDFALSQIIRLYGGMGSLTDIVLYHNGQPQISENNELAKLRTQLFELCMQH